MNLPGDNLHSVGPVALAAALTRCGKGLVVIVTPCDTDAWCDFQAERIALFAAAAGIKGLAVLLRGQIRGHRRWSAHNGGEIRTITYAADAGSLIYNMTWEPAPAILLAIDDDGTHVARAYSDAANLRAVCDALAMGMPPRDWSGPIDARTRWIAWTPADGSTDAVPTGEIHDYRARAAGDG